MNNEMIAVTGAFGYTGKYIARRLLAQGNQVITLTGHPDRPNEFKDRVKAFPFNFEKPDALTTSLLGVETLYNTYWVRFDHDETTFERAVANTRVLIACAQAAGVRRLVHVSISNPSIDSPLPYFRGKALLEEAIQQSGLSYAILRPTVIFGREDVLINNIAYLLRRFPVFAVPGSGTYRLQPVFVEDMAEIAIQAGQSDKNLTLDVVGPEIFTFDELVGLIAQASGSRARLIHLPPGLALALSRLVGLAVGDVVLTRDELAGLSAGLLVSSLPSTGQTKFSEWVMENAPNLGKEYASEIGRHYQ
jgi:uncharacterized protein YbjT (DUF2867 family)